MCDHWILAGIAYGIACGVASFFLGIGLVYLIGW